MAKGRSLASRHLGAVDGNEHHPISDRMSPSGGDEKYCQSNRSEADSLSLLAEITTVGFCNIDANRPSDERRSGASR